MNMKSIITSSHDEFSIRHTDDGDVYFHHVVSRRGDRLLEQEAIEEELWERLKRWNLGKK